VAEYSIFIRPDLLQQFWQVMSEGGFITDAVEVIDTSRRTGRRVLVEAGGVRPRRGRGLKGRCLSFAEREEIALARAAGDSMRLIADRLGRSASTISRELQRNVDRRGRYRATAAHAQAYERASRVRPGKLVTNLALRAQVEKDPEKKYSPPTVSGQVMSLILGFPSPAPRGDCYSGSWSASLRGAAAPRRPALPCAAAERRSATTRCSSSSTIPSRSPGWWPPLGRCTDEDVSSSESSLPSDLIAFPSLASAPDQHGATRATTPGLDPWLIAETLATTC